MSSFLGVVTFAEISLSVLRDVGRLNGRFLGLEDHFVEDFDIEVGVDESAHNPKDGGEISESPNL